MTSGSGRPPFGIIARGGRDFRRAGRVERPGNNSAEPRLVAHDGPRDRASEIRPGSFLVKPAISATYDLVMEKRRRDDLEMPSMGALTNMCNLRLSGVAHINGGPT